MGLIVSPNNDQLIHGSGTSASPWTIAISQAGIKGLPAVINVVVLISAFSAGIVRRKDHCALRVLR